MKAVAANDGGCCQSDCFLIFEIDTLDSLDTLHMGEPSFTICGMNAQQELFRPSDWAERLCGVMTCFAPDINAQEAHLKYSRYVYPSTHAGVKAVYVDAQLAQIEPLAYRFLQEFARDNNLVTLTQDVTKETK